MNWVLPGYSNP